MQSRTFVNVFCHNYNGESEKRFGTGRNGQFSEDSTCFSQECINQLAGYAAKVIEWSDFEVGKKVWRENRFARVFQIE